MKILKKLLCVLLPLAAALSAYAAEPGLTPEKISCAAEDMQLFYHYLNPGRDNALKEFTPKCGGQQGTVIMPEWLDKAVPAMAERKVWNDPEEGKLSEAVVWQTPFSILYEFADLTRKTLVGTGDKGPVSPFICEKEYTDIRMRFMLSVDRIARSRLNDSFEGRGKGLFSTLNMIMLRMDGVTGAISAHDKAGFDNNAAEAAELSRDLFAQLFSAPRQEPVYRYRPEPRVLPGYRGVSLPVPGYQTLFLNSGERIDLLVTFEAITGKGVKNMVTATILQNVVVLKISKPDAMDGLSVVQLLCNPNEAQYAVLSLAQSKSVNIIRRSPGDVEMHPMEIASFVKLFR